MQTGKQQTRSPRTIYGETLIKLGKENKNIVALDADLSCSTQTGMFAKEFPQRFFNVGIAEQDMMCMAAGLSTTGKIPFASTFAMFASGRAWDQVRNTITYPRFNVKIVATHGGITVGEDGASHQALEDISLMRSIPHMVVIVPSDCYEVEAAIEWAAEYKGPVYIRLARTNMPDVFDANYRFDKKARIIKEGSDITILSNGETIPEVIECAKVLEEKGISAEVINVSTVKPLDGETILKSAEKTKRVLTVENHSVIGGLGSAVCEFLSENYPVPVKRIGTNDEFGQSGRYDILMSKYKLTAEHLVEEAEKLVR